MKNFPTVFVMFCLLMFSCGKKRETELKESIYKYTQEPIDSIYRDSVIGNATFSEFQIKVKNIKRRDSIRKIDSINRILKAKEELAKKSEEKPESIQEISVPAPEPLILVAPIDTAK